MSPEERGEEYSPSADYERRKAISRRLYASIWDFSTALNALPADTRKETFQGGFFETKTWVSFDRITSGIGFMLLGLLEERGKDLDDEDYLNKVIEQSLDRMLWGSEKRIGTNTGEIDVEVTIEGWQTHDDFELHQDPAELSDEDLEWLFRMGELTREEFARGILGESSED